MNDLTFICSNCTSTNWPQTHCWHCGEPLVVRMVTHRATVDDFNQRLIDRTSGLLDLVQAQALEIATWKRRHREAVRALMGVLSGQLRTENREPKTSP